MTFILILILVFFVLPYVFRWALTWFARYKMKQFENMVRDAAGMRNGAGQNGNGRHRKENTASSRRRKKIDSDVGEYVAFEELPPLSESSTAGSRHPGPVESQIEDVDWEDV